MRFKDCYYDIKANRLTIANSLIKREYLICEHGLCPVSLTDLQTRYAWCGGDKLNAVATFVSLDQYTIGHRLSNNGELSGDFLEISIEARSGTLTQKFVWEIFPDSPLISFFYELTSADDFTNNIETESFAVATTGVELADSASINGKKKDVIDYIALNKNHYKLTATKFYDKTDKNDELVSVKEESYYRRGQYERTANMLIVDDYLSGNAAFANERSFIA